MRCRLIQQKDFRFLNQGSRNQGQLPFASANGIAGAVGRMMNANLQHYHVPVNADILDVETFFVEEDDKIVNPLGVMGMGELGMVGVPAAIANAIFHATGKRVRDLPITIDKLL